MAQAPPNVGRKERALRWALLALGLLPGLFWALQKVVERPAFNPFQVPVPGQFGTLAGLVVLIGAPYIASDLRRRELRVIIEAVSVAIALVASVSTALPVAWSLSEWHPLSSWYATHEAHTPESIATAIAQAKSDLGSDIDVCEAPRPLATISYCANGDVMVRLDPGMFGWARRFNQHGDLIGAAWWGDAGPPFGGRYGAGVHCDVVRIEPVCDESAR